MIIPLSGINMAESDYATPDGSLDIALNAVPRGGALNNFRQPKDICQLMPGERIVAMHAVDGAKRLICLIDGNPQTLQWRDIEGHPGGTITTLNGFADIAIIGNTLAVADADGLHYILWRDGQYTILGDRPEFPVLEFGLRYPQATSSNELNDKVTVNTPLSVWPQGERVEQDAEKLKTERADFSTAIFGLLLSAVNDKIVSQGYFYQPFFVRYAFRLYDGSYRWHSAPVLMIPTGTPPLVKITAADNSHSTAEAELSVMYFELCYKFTNQPDYSAWKDIISAIDVFISAPIYTYDQASQNLRVAPYIAVMNSEAVGIKKVPYTYVKPDYRPPISLFRYFYFTGNYSEVRSLGPSSADVFFDHYQSSADHYDDYCVWIPRNEYFHEDVVNCCNFYLAQTIDPFIPYEAEPVDDNTFDPDRASKLPYWSYRRIEPIAKSVDALKASKRLPDEYQSHFSHLPKLLHTYNSRLNLANLAMRPPHPYPVRSFKSASGNTDNQCWAVVTVRSVINGTEVVARNADKDTPNGNNYYTAAKGPLYKANLYGGNWWSRHGLSYIYVPDPAATSIEIAFSESKSPDRPTHAYTFPLTPHPLLNGAYWYGQLTPSVSNPDSSDTESAHYYDDPAADFAADISGIATKADIPSKLYTSEVNNPFVYQAANITTVGTGTIVALASAAKPLSQGQFGQFPLYAFTTEGIWALEVSATGGFASRQPISRDVCLSPKAVTPIDSAVLFATARGIMMISGGEVSCISRSIYNPDIPIADPCQLRVKNWVLLHSGGDAPSPEKVGLTEGDTRTPSRLLQWKITTYFSMPDIADMLSDCRLLYSYATQLLYVYRPGDPKDTMSHFAYVFSFESGQWGGAMISIVDSFDSYPHAYAVTRQCTVTGGPGASIRPPQVGEPLPVLPPTLSGGLETIASSYHLSDFDQPHRLSVMFVLTRPLKLAAPDTFKTMLEVHARGQFPRDSARIVLFGAREITGPWIIVGSSLSRRLHRISGSPYKYFRIGVFLDPHIDGNSLSALEVSFIRRYPRRLR